MKPKHAIYSVTDGWQQYLWLCDEHVQIRKEKGHDVRPHKALENFKVCDDCVLEGCP
jgi:hypothetical protein